MKIKQILGIFCLLLFLVLFGLQIKKMQSSSKKKDTNTPQYESWEDLSEGEVVREENLIKIEKEGSYILKGTENGRIEVDAKDATIQLILDGFHLTATGGPALYIKNAKEVIITLQEGSENTIEDCNNYTNTFLEENINGTIFSKADLTFNGTGKITVKANYLDGIVSKDGLTFSNGDYDIHAVGDAIRGKDYVLIENGNYKIEALKDGIKATNMEDSLGDITIQSGIFKIATEEDGIQAESSLVIENGTFDINTQRKNSSDQEEVSAKGIKAKEKITIQNGEFSFNTLEDAIHSNKEVLIENIKATIFSLDDGIHADETITIQNGEIQIKESYEGIEGKDILINGGNIFIIAKDDGINATSKKDSSSFGDRKQMPFKNDNATLTINGGFIEVDASGDGLDANGSIYINEGIILINGPTDNGNGALDYDQELIIKGGTLLASGSSGMMQSASASSTQNTVSIIFDKTLEKEQWIYIESDGKEVIAFRPSKDFRSLVVSMPDLKKGNTYRIYTGGSYSKESDTSLYQNGVYTKGTLYKEFTINTTITNIGGENKVGTHPKDPMQAPPFRR